MRRREFISALSAVAAGWPLTAYSQPAQRMRQVRVLGPSQPVKTAYPSFLTALRKLGFEEGRNLSVAYHEADDDLPQSMVDELQKQEALFVIGAKSYLKKAVAAAPSTPIVVAAINFDLVAEGFAQSLARPGGNITGINSLWPDITAKQVELLQEAFPARNRLGVLWDYYPVSK